MEQTRTSKLIIVCLSAFFVLSGGAAKAAPVADREMAEAFKATLSTKRFLERPEAIFPGSNIYLKSFDTDNITLKQRLFVGRNLYEGDNYMARYGYDSDGDAIAQKYVATAKARGNVVRSYKPKIAGIIFRNFPPPVRHIGGSTEWYEQDRVLIEFDKSGRIVSFLARCEQLTGSLGATIYQHITIFLGPENARRLENKLSQKDLQEYFEREL